MTIIKHLVFLWGVVKLAPEIEKLEHTLPAIESFHRAIPQIEAIEKFIPRLEALDELFLKIEDVNKSLIKLENLERKPKEVVVIKHRADEEMEHEFNRLKMLAKFSRMAGKAREIELEFQQINQDAHNSLLEFHLSNGKTEVEYAYKKGIVEGVKWCVDRFC